MLRKKSSANIENLNATLLQFANDMSDMFDGIVITSGNDSVHMIGSRHYINKALDFGANSSEASAYSKFKTYAVGNSALKTKYNIEDIIDEKDHIHIEVFQTEAEAKTEAIKNFSLVGVGLILVGVFGYLFYKKVK